MAVRIRLKKMGRKHKPFYRLCAMDSRTGRDGRVIEELGYYDPMVRDTDARAILNGERIQYWIGVGAQPSDKAGVLIRKYGLNGTHVEQQKAALEKVSAQKKRTHTAVVNARADLERKRASFGGGKGAKRAPKAEAEASASESNS